MGKFGNRRLPEFMEKLFNKECNNSGAVYYDYWNVVVKTWCKLIQGHLTSILPVTPVAICGWTNPNDIPLFNSGPVASADYSMLYIPEPWWGHAGDGEKYELHSVVINFNPGRASTIQHHHSSNTLFGIPDYQKFVQNEVDNYSVSRPTHFPGTNDWHYTHRALPIFNSLVACGALHRFTVSGLPSLNLQNHLSIELIPWHTPGVGKVKGASGSIFDYINANLAQTFLNTILFAGSRSRCIKNSVLNDVVILRIGITYTRSLLTKLKRHGMISGYFEITDNTLEPKFPAGNGAFLKFTVDHPDLHDIEFISICRPKRDSKQNDFPDPFQMDWIFNNILKDNLNNKANDI